MALLVDVFVAVVVIVALLNNVVRCFCWYAAVFKDANNKKQGRCLTFNKKKTKNDKLIGVFSQEPVSQSVRTINYAVFLEFLLNASILLREIVVKWRA